MPGRWLERATLRARHADVHQRRDHVGRRGRLQRQACSRRNHHRRRRLVRARRRADRTVDGARRQRRVHARHAGNVHGRPDHPCARWRAVRRPARREDRRRDGNRRQNRDAARFARALRDGVQRRGRRLAVTRRGLPVRSLADGAVRPHLHRLRRRLQQRVGRRLRRQRQRSSRPTFMPTSRTAARSTPPIGGWCLPSTPRRAHSMF